jgi:hypothetical protein
VRFLAAAVTALLLGPACAPDGDTATTARDTATTPRDTARDAETNGPQAASRRVMSDSRSEPPAATPVGPPAGLLRHPIIWNAEREALTQAYLDHHTDLDLTGDPQVDSHMIPRVVVVHWTAGPTARSARATFLQTTQKRSRRRVRWNLVNLSSHFIVDHDGTAIQLMDTDRVGRHTIGLNHLAVGIENVGDRKTWPLTRSQVESNADLVRWLVDEHPTITHLIGHYEYRQFEGHPYFNDHTRFRTGRADPGRVFMEALRLEVADLGLQGAP